MLHIFVCVQYVVYNTILRKIPSSKQLTNEPSGLNISRMLSSKQERTPNESLCARAGQIAKRISRDFFYIANFVVTGTSK
jgi:hypothetical protein